MILPRRVVDMAGQRLGHVTVLAYAGISRHRIALWRVLCDCGITWTTSGECLRRGDVKSCGQAGCPHRATRRHGHAPPRRRSAEYRVWRGIKTRCLNPKSDAYPDYGGRGITIWPRWAESFDAFLADVGLRPSPQHSIDRIDNDGPYEPGNVRWATRIDQANNRRTNARIAWRGQTDTLKGWARALGLSYDRLAHRYRAGWPPERMFTTPARRATVITWGGKSRTLQQWAALLGVPFERLWLRHRRGLPPEQILSPGRRLAGPKARPRQLLLESVVTELLE